MPANDNTAIQAKLDPVLNFLDFMLHKSTAPLDSTNHAVLAYHEYKNSLRVPTNPATHEAKGESL